MSLGPALDAVRPAFDKENRNKMSRSVLAKHLGYTSLNGRALGKIGALRAYGLIEGSGDELRITDDAVKALMAPQLSTERLDALGRLANRPSLFQELRKDFPDTMPSLDNLQYALVKRQFTADAAEKAAKSYLATMNLAGGIADAYNPPEDEDESGEDEVPEIKRSPPPFLAPAGKVKLMDGERIVFTEESNPQNYLKLIASGDVDETMLEALEDYVKRQKKRLASIPPMSGLVSDGQGGWKTKPD
jgi:hypothetical protein